ncbi:hypothetical protein ACFL4C_00455 [Candidatus Omnitrophota bacterium]
MGQKGKASVIILVILLVFSFLAAGIVFFLLQSEKTKVADLIQELEIIKTDKRVAENRLTKIKVNLEELNTQYRNVQRRMDELNVELEIAGVENSDLQSEIEFLRVEYKGEEQRKRELQEQRIKAEEEIIDLKLLIHQLQSKKPEHKNSPGSTQSKKEVELGTIVVESKKQEDSSPRVSFQPPQVVPVLEAEILVINKDHDFTVINVGSQAGVSLGELFSVYHEGSYIGDIKVERVQEAMSACGILSQNIKQQLEEGDSVSLNRNIAEADKGEALVVSVNTPQLSVSGAREAEILVINKDYDFAVINVGSQDGIIPGEVFSVYRNGKHIGDIEVDKVQEVMSACKFLSEKVKNNIKESDKVVKK